MLALGTPAVCCRCQLLGKVQVARKVKLIVMSHAGGASHAPMCHADSVCHGASHQHHQGKGCQQTVCKQTLEESRRASCSLVDHRPDVIHQSAIVHPASRFSAIQADPCITGKDHVCWPRALRVGLHSRDCRRGGGRPLSRNAGSGPTSLGGTHADVTTLDVPGSPLHS